MSTAKSIICFFFEHNLPKPRGRESGCGIGVTLGVKDNQKKNKVSAKFKSRLRQIPLGNF